MDEISAAINLEDKNKIASCIAILEELNPETLEKLLGECHSDKMAVFIKQEFFKQMATRDMNITAKFPGEELIESTENTRSVEATEINDSLLHDDELVSATEFDQKLNEKDAIKKYSFKNSKYDKALEMFLNAFKGNLDNVNFDKAGFLSKSIVEHLISEFSSSFPKEVRSKSHNLKENSKLCSKVYELKVTTADFVKMLPSQLQSDELRSKDSEYIKEGILASQIATTAADTDMFRCGKCKQKKCTYTQLQTRSCDEAMTTFITCTNCGNRWKC